MRLISEDKCLLHLGVVFFDISLAEVGRTGILIVYGNDLVESFLQVLGNFRSVIVVLKISAFSLSLHFLFRYGVKCLVIFAFSHLVFSYRPQIR